MSSQEISESMARWSSSFAEDTSKNICSLYDEKASLWGTLSVIKRDNASLIKDYFDKVFKYSNRSVAFTESNIRLFGNIAISSGMYTFSWFNNNVKVTTAARFSFVYINKGGYWFIIEHHSSSIPLVD